MTQKVHIVLNSFEDVNPSRIASKYLSPCNLSVGTSIPDNPSYFDLIILWNLKTIITNLPDTSNVVVFHSSDLPQGRGWAPIYYAIADRKSRHTISAILASPKVDSGDIICKASFAILTSYLADDLRRLDEIVCFLMARKILDQFKGKQIQGYAQTGNATYNKRRYPADSIIDIKQPLTDLLPHIKACSSTNPAFFEFDGVRFSIEISPNSPPPTIPEDLVIKFGQ